MVSKVTRIAGSSDGFDPIVMVESATAAAAAGTGTGTGTGGATNAGASASAPRGSSTAAAAAAAGPPPAAAAAASSASRAAMAADRGSAAPSHGASTEAVAAAAPVDAASETAGMSPRSMAADALRTYTASSGASTGDDSNADADAPVPASAAAAASPPSSSLPKTKAELLAEIQSSAAHLHVPPSAAEGSIGDSPYLLHRTAKDFGGELYYGTVVQCRWVNASETHFAAAAADGGGDSGAAPHDDDDGDNEDTAAATGDATGDGAQEPCWLVVYDDGDAEDVSADDLAEGLLLFEQDQRQDGHGSQQKKKTKDNANPCCSVAGCGNAGTPIDGASDGPQASSSTGTGNLCDFHRRVHRVVRERISWEEAQEGLEGAEAVEAGADVVVVDGEPMDESGLADTETEQEEGEGEADGKGDGDDEDFGTASSSGRRGGRGSATAERKSSRATKFRGNVNEDDEAADGSKNQAPGDSAEKKKSPASTHNSPRKRLSTKKPVYDVDTSEEEEDLASEGDGGKKSGEDSDEDEEKLKMERIVACRTETIKKWREIGSKMNTTEVTNGSRWFQEDTDLQDDDTEERFLIKWRDLSMLHCSWETKRDLLAEVENPKPYFSTFQRKNADGLIFDEDERGDGEFFDPKFVEIERILHVMEAPVPSPPPSRSSSPSGSDGGVRRRLEYSMENTDDKKDGKEEDNELKNSEEKANDNGTENEEKQLSITLTETMVEHGIVLDRSDPRYEDGTGRQFLIKWGNTPYSDCSYEFERDLILNDVEYESHLEAFLQRSIKPTQSEFNAIEKAKEEHKRRLYKIFGENARGTQEERDEKIEEYQQQLVDEEFGDSRNKLRDYQAEGVAWLISNYVNKRSSVLADEMGLGKTVQVASYLWKLAKESHIRGPFLVVVPLSTLEHWLREFAGWTDLNTILYHGSADDRALIREYEFAYHPDRPKNVANRNNFLRRCQSSRAKAKWQRTWMAQVVVTTPEIMTADDFSELMAVKWEVLVVDEAHRVKNFDSKLANNLFSPKFSFGNRVLMTGTPIQNNMQELWTILHFTDPSQFNDQEEFLEKFDGMRNKEVLDELHEKMRPYVLRRLKEDVEKSVPPKEETIIEVELTILQKQYYRALYERNLKFLHRNKKKALDGPSISNLAMQLRKCCNHPFLLRGCEDDARKAEGVDSTDRKAEADFLVRASGKLVLLDKLLPRLQEGGHRVLIFSQFCIMLDILTDYLDLRDFKHERIDGNITGKQRQAAIDRFQAEAQDGKRTPFVMLLSTRAGGVGINLTAADTCIIFDSDWNPQNDLQAQARCHRIGQTKSVKIYRLLTAKSYEMQMFHASSLKLGLDQAVLQGIEGGSGNGENAMSKEEIEKLLRKGAYDVFSEEQAGTSDQASKDFENLDIDSILSRRTKTVVHENTGSNSAAAGGTFSKASFKAANQGGSADVDIDDPDFWKKVVGEAKEDKEEVLGKRKRKQTKSYSQYFEEPASKKIADADADANAAELKDSDYSSAGADDEEDEGAMEGVEPVNAADLVDDKATSGKGFIGPGPGGKKKRKRRKKSSQSQEATVLAERKFIRMRGIVIPAKDRAKIVLIDSNHKILVLHALPRDILIRADEIVSVNGFVVQRRVSAASTITLIRQVPATHNLVIDIIRPVPPDYPAPMSDVVVGHGYTKPFPANFRPILGSIPLTGAVGSTRPQPKPKSKKAVSLLIQVNKERPQIGVSVASNSGRHFVHGISSSGAASATKLRVGDEIVGLNGKSHNDWTVLLKEIHNVKALGLPLRLDIVQHDKRGGTFIRGIIVDRDEKTGRVGIDLQWRSAISGVFVNKITPDTPAATSSIRLRDEIISVNDIRLTGPDWEFKTIMDAIKRMGGSCLRIDIFRPSKDWAAASKARTPTVVAASTAASANVTAPAASPSANTIPQVNLKLRRDPNAPDRPLAIYNTARRSSPLIESDVAPAPPPGKEPVPGSSAWCALQRKRKAEQNLELQEASQINQNKRGREAESSETNVSSREASAPAEASTLAATSTAPSSNDIQEEVLEPSTSRVTGVLLEVEIPPRKEAPSFGMLLEMASGLPIIEQFFPFSFIGQTGKVKLGDFILSINGRSTRATGLAFDEVKKAFASVDKDESLTLEILRPTSAANSTEKLRTIIKGISIHRNVIDEPFGVLVHHDSGEKRGEKRKIFCSGIKPDSPAMREGTLKKFDVILAVNGTDITEKAMSFKEVLGLVRSTKPGEPLVFDIMRNAEIEEDVNFSVDEDSTSPMEKPRESTKSEVAASAASSSKEVPPEEAQPKKAPYDSTKDIQPTELSPKDIQTTEAVSKETHPMVPSETAPKGAPQEAPPSEKTHSTQALAEEASPKGAQSKTPPATIARDSKTFASKAEASTLASQQKPAAPESSKKPGRRKKDPNSPKEPRSAYFFFVVEMCKKVAAEFPGKTPQEIAAIVGIRWKNTAPEQKKKYQDLHEQDRARYRNELAEYNRKQATEATGNAEGEVEGQTAISPPKEDMATASPSKRQKVAAGSEKKERKLTPTGRPACVVEGCTKQNQGKRNNYMCLKHFTASGGGTAAATTAEATAASPAPALSNLKTPASKRKTPSKSTSHSKLSTSAKRPRSSGRKLCSVDQCTKGSQNGTNGLCVSHWNEHVKAQAQANGTSYKDMRVAKTFGTDIYFGSVKTYFEADKEDPKSEALWNIVYDDGDEEDLNVRELAGALRLYNQKKSNDPKANGGGGELPAASENRSEG